MPREVIKFDLTGIEVMIKNLDRIEKDIERRIDATLEKLALKVIADAKRLAPLDKGDLEASLTVGEVKRAIKGKYIDMGNSPETDDYAVVMHEGVYQPGEKTKSKGSYKGFLPGRKFLENALKLNEKLIIDELRKALHFGK